MSVHAFVDESRRNDTYYLAAAIVPPGDLTPLRSLSRGLLFPGQRELHFSTEKQARRKSSCRDSPSSTSGWTFYRASCHRGEEHARQRCLARLTDDLLDVDGRRSVLDSREERDAHDAQTIRLALGKRHRETRLVYEHFPSAGEPLLWLADIAARCLGAGGDWARRAAPMIGSVVRLDWP